MTKKTRILVTGIIVAVTVAFMPMFGGEVSAAAKKPAKPKITSATVTVDSATIKWGKAKNAKKYQVAIRSTGKSWVKYKTVKKTAKNKKKFTKANKYKVVAKGKKYVVYQYTYTYTNKKTTKARSNTFTGLKHNTPYTFAVRSVNGKKYSAWSTVARTTIATENPSEEIAPGTTNTPGAEVPVTFGGVTNTLVIGQESTYTFSPSIGLNTDLKSINVVPTEVRTYDGEGPTGDPYHEINVLGTINGLENGNYAECKGDGVDGKGYFAGVYGSIQDGFVIRNLGGNAKEVKVTNPNITVCWTIDGKEPKLGQEDLIVAGSEYPLGTLKRDREYAPEPKTIKLRGTVSNGQTGEIFGESSAGYINKCIWIRIFENNTLIGERYEESAREQFWPYGDE